MCRFVSFAHRRQPFVVFARFPFFRFSCPAIMCVSVCMCRSPHKTQYLITTKHKCRLMLRDSAYAFCGIFGSVDMTFERTRLLLEALACMHVMKTILAYVRDYASMFLFRLLLVCRLLADERDDNNSLYLHMYCSCAKRICSAIIW